MFTDTAVARLTARTMLIDSGRTSQTPYITYHGPGDCSDELVARSMAWIKQNLHREFGLGEISKHVAVSQRTLIRRFKKSDSAIPIVGASNPQIAAGTPSETILFFV